MRTLLLLLFFPFLAKGQYVGLRTAYTFTNKAYHYGFAGVSNNSDPFYAGLSYYAGSHVGSHKGTIQFVPEIGAEFYALTNKYQIQAGYSLPLRNEATFNGFTLSVVINFFGRMTPWKF